MSKLRRIREGLRLSQADLAERSGLSVRTIRNYESIPSALSRAARFRVIRVCQVLGCSIEDIEEDQVTGVIDASIDSYDRRHRPAQESDTICGIKSGD
jgi:transcriptional regulator with XRE-family HTH domain